MHAAGVLDIQRLAVQSEERTTLASLGLHLESSHRIRVTWLSGRCNVEIGPLDEVRGLLPLATVARDKDHFILSVPGYSFLTLYFTRSGDKLLWSTSIGALASGAGDALPNKEYERFGLKYQLWPGSGTVYARIKKLVPGQQMRITASGHAIEPAPPNSASPEIDPDDADSAQRAIHETLLSAVEQLSPPHQSMGVMLGGFDSALIVALLAELGRPIHAVTLKYNAEKYNQRNIERVIERFGIRHDWVNIGPEVIRDGLYRYRELFDQPVTQPHYVISGIELAGALAERGVSRVLTGDGCDGLFFGYPTVFRKAKLVRALHYLPRAVKRLLRAGLGNQALEYLGGQPVRLARQLLETSCRPDHLHFFLTAMAVDNESADQALMGEPMPESFEAATLESLYEATAKGKDWVDATYVSKNMVGLNRAKLASIWNHSGIEKIHSPYMMPDVSAMAHAIPKGYWMSNETPSGKLLLSKMAVERNILDEAVVYQPKMSPVSSPVDHWLHHELREDVEAMLSRSSSLNLDYCKSLLRERWPEEWYKRKVTIDDYACQALCMLLSYARMIDGMDSIEE